MLGSWSSVPFLSGFSAKGRLPVSLGVGFKSLHVPFSSFGVGKAMVSEFVASRVDFHLDVSMPDYDVEFQMAVNDSG